MRIHAESQIWMPCPIFEIVLGLEAFPREVGYLVLHDPGGVQRCASDKVVIGDGILIWNEVRVISGAAGHQLAPESRILIYLEHVNTDVRHTSINRGRQRLLPAFRSLMWQPGDQVDVDVLNPGFSKACYVVQRRSALV